MDISLEGISLIKSLEGFKAEPYICSGGYKTIGYGHVILSNEYDVITESEADVILFKDIAKAKESVCRNIEIKLKQCQFDALVSFTFNVGGAALQRSTLRQKINRSEHDLIPKELQKWVYAGGRIIPGLIKRRIIEAEVYSN